jgi:exodeoxyribonuclease VIII
MMNDVCVDLESMGTRLDGAIVGIGMVEFDLPQGLIGRTFFRAINLGDAVNNHGAKMDAATVSWWLSQSKAAQGAIVTNCYSVRQALLDVTEFMAGNPDVKVWGNGCFFDNAMLSHLFRVVGLPQPWKFWNDRCYRTVCAMHRSVTKDEFIGTAHNAVDDAMAQVKHLMKIRSVVRGGR